MYINIKYIKNTPKIGKPFTKQCNGMGQEYVTNGEFGRLTNDGKPLEYHGGTIGI